MPRAYSYIRWSTPEQARGDSYRRQTELARRYAEQHDLTLDEDAYADLGVSAFRGANHDRALGRFVEAVDEGKIAKGSYLLVESLDRLSRDRILPALNRFSEILGRGIKVVTLFDGKEYDHASLNDLAGLMVPLVYFARAHDESSAKSTRLKAAWDQRRERARNGQAIGNIGPTWLRLNDNGKWHIIPDRAKAVRRIFKLADQGHGKAGIAARLNEEQVPTLRGGKAWRPAVVQRLLGNVAVIGTFQPSKGEPIEGFYPAIVDKALFYRVRRAPPGASGKGGRPMMNMLAGLVYCAKCGERMAYHPMKSRGKRFNYLRCDGKVRLKICDAPMVRYEEVVGQLFERLEVDKAVIGAAKRGSAPSNLATIEAQLTEAEHARERILQALEKAKNDDVVTILVGRLEQHEAAVYALKADLDQAQAAQADQQDPDDIYDAIIALADELKDALIYRQPQVVEDVRVRLNANLKRVIGRVEVVKGEPLRVVPR
jgi:DNA invertase Pin-like site-specific DNA recombinase